MKLTSLSFFGAALLLLMTSCDGGKTDNIADIEDATTGDSVMFYFGQNLAADFWLSTESDTTLISESAREDYLRGVKAGIAAARNNEAYNKGLFVGVQVATNLKDFRDLYPEVKIDDKVLIAALRAGLESDSAVNVNEVKSQFYKMMDGLARSKEAADAKIAEKLLVEKATELGMKLQAPMLYSKLIDAGKGAEVKSGDRIKVQISVATLDGKMVGMQIPTEIVVGRSYTSPMIAAAIPGMKVGETKQFLSSAMQVTPRRYKLGEYKADQLMKFTIKVDSLISGANESVPADSIQGM